MHGTGLQDIRASNPVVEVEEEVLCEGGCEGTPGGHERARSTDECVAEDTAQASKLGQSLAATDADAESGAGFGYRTTVTEDAGHAAGTADATAEAGSTGAGGGAAAANNGGGGTDDRNSVGHRYSSEAIQLPIYEKAVPPPEGPAAGSASGEACGKHKLHIAQPMMDSAAGKWRDRDVLNAATSTTNQPGNGCTAATGPDMPRLKEGPVDAFSEGRKLQGGLPEASGAAEEARACVYGPMTVDEDGWRGCVTMCSGSDAGGDGTNSRLKQVEDAKDVSVQEISDDAAVCIASGRHHPRDVHNSHGGVNAEQAQREIAPAAPPMTSCLTADVTCQQCGSPSDELVWKGAGADSWQHQLEVVTGAGQTCVQLQDGKAASPHTHVAATHCVPAAMYTQGFVDDLELSE